MTFAMVTSERADLDRTRRAAALVYASASMLPLLAMGRDVPGGRMELRDGLLTLDWDPDGASDPYFSFVESRMRTVTAINSLLDRVGRERVVERVDGGRDHRGGADGRLDRVERLQTVTGDVRDHALVGPQ